MNRLATVLLVRHCQIPSVSALCLGMYVTGELKVLKTASYSLEPALDNTGHLL